MISACCQQGADDSHVSCSLFFSAYRAKSRQITPIAFGNVVTSIVLNAHNLLNKRYFNHLSRLKNIGDGIPEMGRNIGMKIVYNL